MSDFKKGDKVAFDTTTASKGGTKGTGQITGSRQTIKGVFWEVTDWSGKVWALRPARMQKLP